MDFREKKDKVNVFLFLLILLSLFNKLSIFVTIMFR